MMSECRPVPDPDVVGAGNPAEWRVAIPVPRVSADDVALACIRLRSAFGTDLSMNALCREIAGDIDRPGFDRHAVEERILADIDQGIRGRELDRNECLVSGAAFAEFILHGRGDVGFREAIRLVGLTRDLADAFATRTRVVGDETEISVTRFDPEAGDPMRPVAGKGAYPFSTFRVDHLGRVEAPPGMSPLIRVEMVAWWLSRHVEKGADHFAAAGPSDFLEWARRFAERECSSDMWRMASGPRSGFAIAAAARFAHVAAGRLDREVMEAIDANLARADFEGYGVDEAMLVRFPDAVTKKDPDFGCDAYRWVVSDRPETRRRRLQALRVAPYMVSRLARDGTTAVEDGESVHAVLGRMVGVQVPARWIAKAVHATGDGWHPPAPNMTVDNRRVRYVDKVGRICRLTSAMGGTNVLDVHPVEDVHRLAECILCDPFLGGSGRLPASVGSAVMREAPALRRFFDEDGPDYLAAVERHVVDGLRQDTPVVTGMVTNRMLILRVMLDAGATASALVECSRRWHASAGDLQGRLDDLRVGGPRSVEPPTETILRLPGGTIRWLLSSAELRSEGDEMNHCVASYADAVLAGRSSVASLVATDGSRATLEARTGPDGTLHVAQFRSVANSSPSPACRTLLDDLVDGVRDGSIAWTPPVRLPTPVRERYAADLPGSAILAVIQGVLPRRVASWSLWDWSEAIEATLRTEGA